MSKPILLVDLDGVCADLCTEWLNRYNADYHDRLTPDDITAWETSRFVSPACGAAIYTYLEAPGLFRHLPRIQGCATALRLLAPLTDIVVVSNSPKHAYDDKAAWVADNLPMVEQKNIVFTARKDLVIGDIIVDDYPENLRGPHPFKILFDAPWNRSEHGLLRAKGWGDVFIHIYRYLHHSEES